MSKSTAIKPNYTRNNTITSTHTLNDDTDNRNSNKSGSLLNEAETYDSDANYNQTPLNQAPVFSRQLRFSPSTVGGGGGGVSNINNSIPNNTMNAGSSVTVDKKKIGHREVKDGVVHYKSVPVDELKKSIQFGIVYSIGVSTKYTDRDLLMQDFQDVDTINFPQ